MNRKIEILHWNGVVFTQVFEWNTKKSGTSVDVLDYLINKFRTNPPAKYKERPIQKGDRIRVTLMEGPFAGEVEVYEMISLVSVRKIGTYRTHA